MPIIAGWLMRALFLEVSSFTRTAICSPVRGGERTLIGGMPVAYEEKMSMLKAPINPNGKQETPKPSQAIPDTPLEGPLACNCDQALLLLELLASARETITNLREEVRNAKTIE